MNIVLDTNVLVAGLLSPFGPCGQIVRMVSSGELPLCFDARILSEYEEVLGRPKFKFEKDKVIALLDHIRYRGLTTASSPLYLSLPDPDDEPFLKAAIAAPVFFSAFSFAGRCISNAARHSLQLPPVFCRH